MSATRRTSCSATVNLPTGAQASLSPDATPVGEIYRYTLKAPPGFPETEMKALEDWVVERQFRTVPGVVDVVGFGGPTKQYQVLIDPAKLKSYNITLQPGFHRALQWQPQRRRLLHRARPGDLHRPRARLRARRWPTSRDIAVDTRNGTPDPHQRPRHACRSASSCASAASARSLPGQPDEDDVAEGIVILRRGENALEVLKRVRAKVADINQHYLPPACKLVTYYDRTELIDRTLHTVRKNMIEGIGLVLLVLILFLGLGNYRSALVVAAVVPLSLLGAFLLLDLRGIPANLISMGAIDFGIIVDSAVVIIENLLRLLEEKQERFHPLPATIVEAVAQMGKPILFSKAILLTAFIPLYTLQRVEGKIFRPMALTLTFALVVGTVLALTVVPVLASFAVRTKFAAHESVDRALAAPALPAAAGLALRARVVVIAVARAAARRRRCRADSARHGVSAEAGRRLAVGARLHAADHFAERGRQARPKDPRRSRLVSRSQHRRQPARPARRRHGRQRLRRGRMRRGAEPARPMEDGARTARRLCKAMNAQARGDSRRRIPVQPDTSRTTSTRPCPA